MPRKEYEMTEEEFNELLDACKPVPYIIIGGHEPPSQQENANRFWKRLAGPNAASASPPFSERNSSR